MPRDTDVRIVTIEPAEGATVEKKPGPHPSSYGYCPWKIDVIYVLEDGRRIPATSRHGLKRDAVAELASLPHPPRVPTTASFTDDGEFFGTCETYETVEFLEALGQGKRL